jgi:hypothetical protein
MKPSGSTYFAGAATDQCLISIWILEMAHEPDLEKMNTTQKQIRLMPELQERTPGKTVDERL